MSDDREALGGAASGAASGAAIGSLFSPVGTGVGAAIGGAIGLFGAKGKAKSARLAAEARAASLKKRAGQKLAIGEEQAKALLAQGGADKTSMFSDLMGKNISRNASIVDMSLDEISSRAQYGADKARESARLDAEAIMEDRESVISDWRDQRNADRYTYMGSVLEGLGTYKKNNP